MHGWRGVVLRQHAEQGKKAGGFCTTLHACVLEHSLCMDQQLGVTFLPTVVWRLFPAAACRPQLQKHDRPIRNLVPACREKERAGAEDAGVKPDPPRRCAGLAARLLWGNCVPLQGGDVRPPACGVRSMGRQLVCARNSESTPSFDWPVRPTCRPRGAQTRRLTDPTCRFPRALPIAKTICAARSRRGPGASPHEDRGGGGASHTGQLATSQGSRGKVSPMGAGGCETTDHG